MEIATIEHQAAGAEEISLGCACVTNDAAGGVKTASDTPAYGLHNEITATLQ